MRLTRVGLISDLQKDDVDVFGHLNAGLMSSLDACNIDIKREILGRMFALTGHDLMIFKDMTLWCFDNCRGKWVISWNLDKVFFTEECDMVAFKLMWA